jgi:hypothetical protein
MTRISPIASGLAFSAFAILVHFAWAVLVAAGAAQPLIDLVLRLHFLQVDVHVAPFDLGGAALLLVYAAVVGFVGGMVLAFAWNSLARNERLS